MTGQLSAGSGAGACGSCSRNWERDSSGSSGRADRRESCLVSKPLATGQNAGQRVRSVAHRSYVLQQVRLCFCTYENRLAISNIFIAVTALHHCSEGRRQVDAGGSLPCRSSTRKPVVVIFHLHTWEAYLPFRKVGSLHQRYERRVA